MFQLGGIELFYQVKKLCNLNNLFTSSLHRFYKVHRTPTYEHAILPLDKRERGEIAVSKNLIVFITTAFLIVSCSSAVPDDVPQSVEEQVSEQNPQSEDSVTVDATETSEHIDSAHVHECMTAVGNATIECHDDHIVIESNGLPEHTVMVGIGAGAWNGQWPTAQDYTGNNAFYIPTLFELDEEPHYFVRNVAGVTANGIPIFLPTAPGRAGSEECLDLPLPEGALAQGECLRDPVGVGEMDECGGHTGRGNDYHYHATPTCLLRELRFACNCRLHARWHSGIRRTARGRNALWRMWCLYQPRWGYSLRFH